MATESFMWFTLSLNPTSPHRHLWGERVVWAPAWGPCQAAPHLRELLLMSATPAPLHEAMEEKSLYP
jgi:hypothetical protein